MYANSHLFNKQVPSRYTFLPQQEQMRELAKIGEISKLTNLPNTFFLGTFCELFVCRKCNKNSADVHLSKFKSASKSAASFSKNEMQMIFGKKRRTIFSFRLLNADKSPDGNFIHCTFQTISLLAAQSATFVSLVNLHAFPSSHQV